MTQRGTNRDTSNFSTVWTTNNPPYAILKWSIENFSCAQNSIRSPCYEISQTSKWNLLVEPNVVENEDVYVVFYLRRDPRCSRPARLRLRGEFSVHNSQNDLIYDKSFEEVYDSSLNSTIEFRLPKVCFFARNSGCVTLDTYLARCEMIISEEINFPDDRNLYLEKLSRDYKQMYEKGKFTDVTIRASDDVISAHKAILCARSLALSEILETSGTYISEDEKSSLLAAALSYIYAGNPDLLLTSLPLEVFGRIALIASKWEMNDLCNIFTPVRMHCKTVLKFEDFLYTWELKNFSRLICDARGCLHSPDFSLNDGTNCRWKVIIEKNSRENGETYGLYVAKQSPGNVSHKIDLEMSMHNKAKNCTVTRRREYTIAPRNVQKFGFSIFLDRNYMQSEILKDESLYIDCRMKFLLHEESWVNFQARLTDVSDEDSYSLKYLKTLSGDFKDLYVSKKWSDIVLFAKDEALNAHRAVLCARSPYFSNMLCHSSQEYINVPIEPSTLKEVLLYIYSAELPTLNCQNCLRLYRACKLIQVVELWEFCRQFILRNINVDIVLDVIELALENSDTELENKSFHFICITGNARMIINTEKWRNFCIKCNDFAMRIYHEIAWNSCNHVCIQ